ncbi:symmetrical bis(5'-nucleosyl)-tetraphosphatase [Pararobbsia silviterrae]|uniref:Bis(5'-nucleosyl)-tetraphosphatase, symmetrical n=1 Tax=Pararobbsia silviterrae TaxID=1792498 RepID=A0A494Y8P4_9BURK|nr:symmetrical bis(5'-nucleosyl)-tetraphosphatase [Pararobbsia silviterrae]RKP59062.1 symmetrical bis(5'-nucleosyl)-tetraphosphatase [Pararobbsia silviterrae]
MHAQSFVPYPVAIGDLQGCHTAFKRLLTRIEMDATTPIWLTGDLVNRGPASLDTLRAVIALGDRAKVVLGNHDLHLLAIAAGAHTQKKGDTLDDIFSAPDVEALIDWLRRQPLAHFDHGFLMVHAGVLPQWSVEQTLALAAEVERELRGDNWKAFLKNLWGNEPAAWSGTLKGDDRTRVIVNALTRLRFCDPNGKMEFKANGGIDSAPPGYLPWFDVPGRKTAGTPIVFGHWAALGLHLRSDICALDSGCVWGNKLSALRLVPDPEHRTLIQVKCGESSGA